MKHRLTCACVAHMYTFTHTWMHPLWVSIISGQLLEFGYVNSYSCLYKFCKVIVVKIKQYLDLMNFAFVYRDSQEYMVLEMEFTIGAHFLVWGYFVFGVCFKNCADELQILRIVLVVLLGNVPEFFSDMGNGRRFLMWSLWKSVG